ncbi:protein YgfX [Hahella ganghwensis]|uniref:protein YgfX n=1 Tax=Hahella ganghwensis TaxID=286420 RepID=UPI0012FA0079|nr:protein YgfX [Hahella ganghwensis]
MFSPSTTKLKPSLTVCLLLTLLFTALGLILFHIDLPDQWLWLLAGAIAIHWIYAIGLHGLRVWPNSITAIDLTLDQQGEVNCRIHHRRGTSQLVILDRDSLLTAPLTILSCRPDNSSEQILPKFKRQLVILTKDSTNPEDYRRLRVLLRMAPQATPPS